MLLIALPLLLVVCNSKTVTVTAEDKQVIQAFTREWQVDSSAQRIHNSFENEVQFIAASQKAVLRTIRHKEVDQNVFGHLAFYYKNRKGFCYDRAALMEKFFAHYGFPFRHVYLYFGQNGEEPGVFSLFKKILYRMRCWK